VGASVSGLKRMPASLSSSLASSSMEGFRLDETISQLLRSGEMLAHGAQSTSTISTSTCSGSM